MIQNAILLKSNERSTLGWHQCTSLLSGLSVFLLVIARTFLLVIVNPKAEDFRVFRIDIDAIFYDVWAIDPHMQDSFLQDVI